MSKIAITVLFTIITLVGYSQNDPVLFTVDDDPVHLSEFDYIYSKNSGKSVDYSQESLEEYLDLYVKFKLKVQKAKELELDTIADLKRELAGYRKQLAKAYLTDKEVTEELMQEAYERMKRDVKLKQILIMVPSNPSEEVLKMKEEKINAAYRALEEGMSFDQAIRTFTESKSINSNRGHLGYKTALFPNKYYELENAAFDTPVGEYSKPVRSPLGYHILYVEDDRPARGEMEVAHILIRRRGNNSINDANKAKIDSIYQELKEGQDFAKLARKYSEDKSSSNDGGYIGYLGINKYEKPFEDAAFSLNENGEFSEPIKSSVGWHIIKRISERPIPTYEDARKTLRVKILQDSRFQQATDALVEKIKEESHFQEDEKILQEWTKTLDKSFFKYNWQPEDVPANKLLNFGDDNYSLQDFAEYAQKQSRRRIQMESKGLETAISTLYHDFVVSGAMKYEENHLEDKYPDFKALMREYEEGILLFEITKMNVWDKASQDSIGLKKFFAERRAKYQWKERADVTIFLIKSADKDLLKRFAKKAKSKNPEWLKDKFGDIFITKDQLYERGSKDISGMKFKVNSVSEPIIDERTGKATIFKINKIIPPTPKTLKEARGYVEADYQDKLEKEWLASLKNQYKVVINKDVLNSLKK